MPFFLLTFFSLFSLFTSCATVSQIDRGRLAKPIMALEPAPREKSALSDFHTTREGAAGGAGMSGGGGCGCK